MSSNTMTRAFAQNFLGNAADWYKFTIIAFLVINPILLYTVGPFITGWVIVLEFIFTLAMALKCYPLQPGGLIAIQAVILGLVSTETIYHEVEVNLEVILLLVFMVAGIYFLKQMLLYVFTRMLLGIRSKTLLSLMFVIAAAVLSAFLDALTVTAVVIAVAAGFYSVYHKVASGKGFDHDHDHADDTGVQEDHRSDLEQFRSFLRNLVMHAAVGTALGGVMTIVGEPQNLLIAGVAGWDFQEFFLRMAPVTIPVFFAGLITTVLCEKLKLVGYGTQLPEYVREVLTQYASEQDEKRTKQDWAVIIAQGLVAIFLVIALAFHFAAVGIIGLTVIVLATAFTGVIQEHRIGHAFEEALPFTALLVVFFGIVGVINEQGLFTPIIEYVFTLPATIQPSMFFIANGVLSMISDNVFVATVYIGSVEDALIAGDISREVFDQLTIAINTGTNLPSVATPNGQAAFLFLLTSALAPLIRLSYLRMALLALPYTVVLSIVGLVMVYTQI